MGTHHKGAVVGVHVLEELDDGHLGDELVDAVNDWRLMMGGGGEG
jgi:hypothetical protein